MHVETESDVEGYLALAYKRRKSGSTSLNNSSSRSHAIFTLKLVNTTSGEVRADHRLSFLQEVVVTSLCLSVQTWSRLSIVDLAGSERTKRLAALAAEEEKAEAEKAEKGPEKRGKKGAEKKDKEQLEQELKENKKKKFNEACAINQSLMALGQCLDTLRSNQEVPKSLQHLCSAFSLLKSAPYCSQRESLCPFLGAEVS
jgi:hypothetical protein